MKAWHVGLEPGVMVHRVAQSDFVPRSTDSPSNVPPKNLTVNCCILWEIVVNLYFESLYLCCPFTSFFLSLLLSSSLFLTPFPPLFVSANLIHSHLLFPLTYTLFHPFPSISSLFFFLLPSFSVLLSSLAISYQKENHWDIRKRGNETSNIRMADY